MPPGATGHHHNTPIRELIAALAALNPSQEGRFVHLKR
jgi:hypothetical protein